MEDERLSLASHVLKIHIWIFLSKWEKLEGWMGIQMESCFSKNCCGNI